MTLLGKGAKVTGKSRSFSGGTVTPGELKKAVERLIQREDADVYVYSADIMHQHVERFRRVVCAKKSKRATAVLFLTTPGGDADAAYRLAACLKRAYQSYDVYVFGRCKSAGTLAVLGAKTIVFGDFGELGPLDVQLAKRDELVASNSGLDIFQAIAVLTNASFESFEQCFLNVVAKSNGNISAKMAADIATQMAVGLFAPMTAQIDPERLGEVQRAVNIANAYGERLDTGNLKRGALDILVEGYPTHSFVIDYSEASKLFNRVREANANEAAIADVVPGIKARTDTAVILDLEQVVSAAGQGVGNAAKRKPTAKKPAGRAGRGARAIIATLEPNAGRHAEDAEKHPDADEGGARVSRRSGRTGGRARPRLVGG